MLEIATESRLADLARREADIGIRIVRTSSPTLIEKPVGRLPIAVLRPGATSTAAYPVRGCAVIWLSTTI
jgi:DNA-binding transcriptional LysR family regulator